MALLSIKLLPQLQYHHGIKSSSLSAVPKPETVWPSNSKNVDTDSNVHQSEMKIKPVISMFNKANSLFSSDPEITR